jgi:large subunit ribosomal protein L15
LNVDQLSNFIESGKLETEITIEDLITAGLIHKNGKVKLLGNGEIEQKVAIEVHACSNSAREKVEKAGGTVTIVS